jgi:hypothetical protein
VWDSAAFSSIFLASSFFCSQTESTPAHTQVTQTVRRKYDGTQSDKMLCIVLFLSLDFFLRNFGGFLQLAQLYSRKKQELFSSGLLH